MDCNLTPFFKNSSNPLKLIPLKGWPSFYHRIVCCLAASDKNKQKKPVSEEKLITKSDTIVD